jgi:putative (di)nucleoside polyphosphate hydrolase
MVLNREGLVWIGRRMVSPGEELSGSTHLWQMPQGGIDKGEEAESAARRELWEETGIRSVSLLAAAPDWIYYDLPENLVGTALKGKFRGQKQRWFAYRFTGPESEIAINPPPGGHAAEFDEWAWKPMAKLPELIVPFKRKVYEDVIAAFGHLGA